MLIIVLLIAAFNLTSSAPVLPSTSDFEAAGAPVTIFGRELPECVNVARYRTVQDIALSCLATIFACTWVALHPNVPPPGRSKWKNFWGGVGEMVIAILAPEMLVGRALGEWRAAIGNAVIYNGIHHHVIPQPPLRYLRWYFCQGEEPGLWTLTHGFLLGMGGLVDDSRRVIDSARGIPERLDISTEEINDKSKGDFLTKALVVLQTTWFIVQCLARWITHLPVTELEVTTLAYAVLNIATYALWWNKPQRMELALRMSRYKWHEGELEGIPSEVVSWENTDKAHPLSKTGFSWDSRSMKRVAQVVKSFICRWSLLIAKAVIHLPNYFRSWTISVLEWALKPLGLCKTDEPLVLFVVIGSVFGGLHLLPIWLSSFPSPVEKLLWKICAILVTIQPFTFLCGAVLIDRGMDDPDFPFSVWGVISIFLYVVARIILLVLAFTTLRKLPPAPLQNITWTTFIPHL